jgi:hypothetical protein
MLLGACASPVAPGGPADVVIAREQFGTTVGVKVGQTIAIPWSNSDNWRIEFASPPLELIKPDAPSSGWRFRAVAAGDTDIVLTLITTGDAAPPRLAVNIQVTR